MQNLGPAGDFLRISEHYRGLSDDELLDLSRESSELTDIAQQALTNEISHRKLKVPPQAPPTRPEVWTPPDTSDPNDPYAEDHELVAICTVWSLADAFQVQKLLDMAAIPFFMGPEKATDVDAVTSNFAAGVEVKIMSIGFPWARQAMQFYEPINDKTPKDDKEAYDAVSIRCPKCHSTEVVFEETLPVSVDKPWPQKYKWTCDSCGHEWEDDGLTEDRSKEEKRKTRTKED
jgi:DNA-directed RNA polymerase subunit M/transcription elongation factor TFIIS